HVVGEGGDGRVGDDEARPARIVERGGARCEARGEGGGERDLVLLCADQFRDAAAQFAEPAEPGIVPAGRAAVVPLVEEGAQLRLGTTRQRAERARVEVGLARQDGELRAPGGPVHGTSYALAGRGSKRGG